MTFKGGAVQKSVLEDVMKGSIPLLSNDFENRLEQAGLQTKSAIAGISDGPSNNSKYELEQTSFDNEGKGTY